MRVVHPQQPFCRCCGAKLKRSTETHVFGIPDGSAPSTWGSYGTPHPETPSTRTEAQRFINQRIVSSKKGYGGDLVVTTWDGETYWAVQEFFCTLRCAADYGRFAVIHAPDLRTQKYADAILNPNPQEGEEEEVLPELPSGVAPSELTDPQSQHSDGEG